MPQFWEQDAVVGPAPTRGAPQPILTVADTDKQADNARADAQLGLSQTQTGIAVRQEADSNLKDQIGNAGTLQTRYETLAPVKEYRTMLPQFMQGLQTAPDATGDQTLLYAYAKIMDPGSVVRESEQGAAAGGASVFDASVAKLKKQLGIEGGGALAPDIRDRLKRDMLQRVQQAGKMYRQQRDRFSSDAQAYGIDPVRVVGPDDFAPYEQEFAAWKQKQQPTQPAAGGARDPEMVGGLPKGTDIQFGMDGVEEPFDHDRWLKQTYGMTPDQEPLVTAFWNQNSGNPRLTVDAAKAWYASKGLPAPEDGSLADGVARARAGQQFGGFDDTAAREEYTKQLRANLKGDGFDATSGGAYAARAAGGLEAGFADEIEGVGGGIDALLNNRGVADGYRLARDQSRQAHSDMQDQQGWLGTAAELAGGLVGGGIGATKGTMTAARAAREGAIMGGVAGFGYGEGAQDSIVGAAGGAAVGGGAGYALGRGAEALAARRAATAPTAGAEVIGAADDLNAKFGTNIAPIPADVAGTTTRRVTGGAAQFPLAAGSIVRGAEKVSNETKAARDGIAALTGAATTNEAAGEAAVRGAETYMKRSKTKVDALYTKARSLGGNEPVDLADARSVLDQNIAELSSTPGGAPGLSELQALRAELDAPFPVEGVKRMRTTLRDRFLKDGLRGTDLERRINQVVDAADDDITSSLAAAGKPDAVAAYRAAAAAHKERIGIIDDVLAPFIGKNGDKSVEDVMKAVDTATKTKGARLGKFLSSIPPDDAGTVRATIITKLGQSSAGTQGAAGDAFSLPQFLTHWNQMSGKAKSELFGGEVRASLENLAKVAEGTKEAQRFANFSNTGSTIGVLATGANGAGFFAAPITSTVALAVQFGAGKLLASPSFARWLAKMPANPGMIEKHVGALTRIAANDNAIAADLIGLRDAVVRAMEQGAARTAAAPAPRTERTAPEAPR